LDAVDGDGAAGDQGVRCVLQIAVLANSYGPHGDTSKAAPRTEPSRFGGLEPTESAPLQRTFSRHLLRTARPNEDSRTPTGEGENGWAPPPLQADFATCRQGKATWKAETSGDGLMPLVVIQHAAASSTARWRRRMASSRSSFAGFFKRLILTRWHGGTINCDTLLDTTSVRSSRAQRRPSSL